MKLKAEPCINNYLTIHVPAATLLNEYRSKKREKQSADKNPFMNEKLQNLRRSHSQNIKDIKCIYTSLPNRSYAKKKNIEVIPLLKNIKLNTDMKLRIVKERKQNIYNLVFQRKKMSCEGLVRRQSPRGLGTQSSRRTIPRNFLTSETMRKPSSPLIEFRQTAPIKIDSIQWHNSEEQNMTQSQQLRLKVMGSRAPISQTVDHLKNGSKQMPTKKSILYKDLYSSRKEHQQYI